MSDKFDITGLIFLAVIIFGAREHYFPDGFRSWIFDKYDAFCHKFAEMLEPVWED